MKGRAWWLIAATAIVAMLALGAWAYHTASEFQLAARQGKAAAAAGVKALSAKQPEAAAASFATAEAEFVRARAMLGPEWLRPVPWLGRQLAAAEDLTVIGAEGSSAGGEAAALMSQVAGVPDGEDRLSVLLELAHPHLDAALVSLVAVAERADGLSTDGLVPELATAVEQAQEVLAPLQLLLQRSEALLTLERYLFTGERRFLVVNQNSAELRPTGGFMGTFGLIEVGSDGFHLAAFTDGDLLPRDTLDLPIPEGGQVNYKHFYFRNTNWWMDFPTSATMMLRFWENLKQPAVDGVIAIDIPAVRSLLEIFGPISVPESKLPLTAENVMEQLTYVVEYEMGLDGPGKKKNAVASLATELLHRVTNMTGAQLAPTMQALADSANEKHVQIYLRDPPAQAAMVVAGWSGAIAAGAEVTDLLAVSNGVIKPSKANFGVDKSLDYQVSLAADGSADTTATLGYRKSPQLLPGVPQQWLANYVRAHRLPGTQLVSGGDEFEALADATGLPTFGHYFRLDPGEATKVVLRASVPDAQRPAGASARNYRLLIAKQADLVDTELSVQVVAPPGWRVASATANWRVSGAEIEVANSGDRVRLATPLLQDVILDVALIAS